MAKNLDVILVVDLESTCNEGWPTEKGEIIELGMAAVLLRTDELEIHQAERLLVRPSQTEVTPFCTNLTGIKPEDVASAPTLGEALKQVAPWVKSFDRKADLREITWASWGDYDRRQLQRECERKHIAYPFGVTHLNVKNLYALMNALERELSVAAACDRETMDFEGRLHNGRDDALNIARLLRSVLEMH